MRLVLTRVRSAHQSFATMAGRDHPEMFSRARKKTTDERNWERICRQPCTLVAKYSVLINNMPFSYNNKPIAQLVKAGGVVFHYILEGCGNQSAVDNVR